MARTAASSSSRRTSSRIVKVSGFLVAALLVLVFSATLVTSQSSSDPVGPLSTDNAQSACVEYGDCTALASSNTYTTVTQESAVTSPASTTIIAAPTDSAESEASEAQLASTGAAAAYSQLSGSYSLVTSGLVSYTGTVEVVTSVTTGATSTDASSNAALARAFGGGMDITTSDAKVFGLMFSVALMLFGLLVVL